MPVIRTMVPLMSVALLTLLAALPFGLPVDTRYFLPMLPYTAIHYWAVRRSGLMPEWGVFLAGLVTDVLTHGPLGYWSLIFLVGVVTVDATRDMPEWGALGRWGQFCVTALLMGLVEWIIASVYVMQAVPWKPIVLAVIMASLCYPLISALLRPFNRLWLRSENGSLARGG